MPSISLTSFVDIVYANTGTAKVNKLKEIKYGGEYTPAKDFYKPFREHVVHIHELGGTKGVVDDILGQLVDAKKRSNYPALVSGYKKFWGRRKLVWFEPPKADWSSGGLDVRVNPELGLEVDGTRYLVKLYMKSEPLSKRRLHVITYLMEAVFPGHAKKAIVMSVLDVRRGKLFTPTVPIPTLPLALAGEVGFIVSIWDQL